jgi:hypothetical protein
MDDIINTANDFVALQPEDNRGIWQNKQPGRQCRDFLK